LLARHWKPATTHSHDLAADVEIFERRLGFAAESTLGKNVSMAMRLAFNRATWR
jgi:hypothetical protein